jgi:hypothetical protein
LRLPLPEGEQLGPAPTTVETPDAEKPQPLRVEGEASKEQFLTYADTRRAGLYKLSWNVIGAGDRTETFAVVPDRRESQLARITPEQLRGFWGTFQPQIISAVSAADAPLAVRGQEVWRTLAIGMLGLLVVESCFATWTGRQR